VERDPQLVAGGEALGRGPDLDLVAVDLVRLRRRQVLLGVPVEGLQDAPTGKGGALLVEQAVRRAQEAGLNQRRRPVRCDACQFRDYIRVQVRRSKLRQRGYPVLGARQWFGAGAERQLDRAVDVKRLVE